MGCGKAATPTCPDKVANPDSTVFTSQSVVSLSPDAVATGESAIGDAVTDGYLRALVTSSVAPVAAFETANAIDDDAACGVDAGVLSLPAGPVTTQDLRNALQTTDVLVAEKLLLHQVFNILEHGVAGPAGAIDTSSGRLVMVSGLEYTVDCSQPTEEVISIGGQDVRVTEGSRVTSLTLNGQTFARSDEDSDTVPLGIVLPESLAQGRDDFFDLRDGFREQGSAAYQASSTTAFNAVDAFLATLQAGQGSVTLGTGGRITLKNCGS
jgi:hypothetical protein